MTIKVEGLYKLEWRLRGTTPHIFLFYRGKNRVKGDGKKPYIEINDFRPYIYVEDKAENFLKANASWVVNVEKVDRPTLDGVTKGVLKVTLLHPKLVHEIKDRFKTWESDILFPMRYMIDKDVQIESGDYRKMYLDIETTTQHGFPSYKNPIEPITCLTFTTNHTENIMTLLLSPDGTIKHTADNGNWKIREFKDERSMLTYFIEAVHVSDPDIFCAWNIAFDMFYLIHRMQKLGIQFQKLSKYGNEVRIIDRGIKSDSKRVEIFGAVTFDLLTGYKKIVLKELPSYSLDYVTQIELGEGGGKKRILDMTKAWKEETKDFAEYNYKDVVLIKKLDAKVGIVDYADEIKNLGSLGDINSAFQFSRVIDSILLKKYGKDYVFIDKAENKKAEIKGGYVANPHIGVHDWVFVWDYSGMYPSIVKSFNLSFDTVNTDREDIVVETDETDERCKRIAIRFDKRGMLPQVLDDLINWRKHYKKMMKNYPERSREWQECYNKQFAAKFLINASAYGVNANPYFRLYKPAVASAITFFGRSIIKGVSDQVEKELNYRVRYGDTDSLFVHIPEWKGKKLKEMTDEERKKAVTEIANEVTPRMNEFTRNVAKKILGKYYKDEEFVMSMAAEKCFSKFLMSQKKRYIGNYYWKEGTFYDKPYYTFVGVDIKRNNIPEVVKQGLKDFIDALFKEEDYEVVIKRVLKEIRTSNDMDKFKIPLKLEKVYKVNVPQQRAANYANEKFKLNFQVGSKYYGLYTVSNRGINTNVIGFDFVSRLSSKEINSLDRDKYISMYLDKINLLYPSEAYKHMATGQVSLSNFFNKPNLEVLPF